MKKNYEWSNVSEHLTSVIKTTLHMCYMHLLSCDVEGAGHFQAMHAFLGRDGELLPHAVQPGQCVARGTGGAAQ